MIAAVSIAFMAYASPLASAKDYIWTTPNMPSNIAGVVAGPSARTEDIAYIHEAIAERRVLGGLGSGASTMPVQVLRSAALPLTPQQAQAKGWQVVSTGIVDGVVNVLAYYETVTDWPKAGGVDTWRMQPVTFSLPGGTWIHPSNDVSSLTSAIGDSFTNCFNPWRGYMQPTNMALRGLAWRQALTNVLGRLADYKLDVMSGVTTNNRAISRTVSRDFDVEVSDDGKRIYTVPSDYSHVATNSANLGFRAYREAVKVTRSYADDDGNLRPCEGSPLRYTTSYLTTTIGTPPSARDVRITVPIPFCFSTGGVWRITSAKAIAHVYYDYDHSRFTVGIGYETVAHDSGYVSVPVSVSQPVETDDGYYLVVRATTPLDSIAASAASVAGVPASDSGFTPLEPQGQMGGNDLLANFEEESLDCVVLSFTVILTVRPLTTIQEL